MSGPPTRGKNRLATSSRSRGFAWSKEELFRLNQAITCGLVLAFLCTWLFSPSTVWGYAIDILFRAHITFLGTVMAHEATHGLLGRTRRDNHFWGRLSLIPAAVPFADFARTHLLHHAYTNIPDKDPDFFMHAEKKWQLPLRAFLMPRHWFVWLKKRGRIDREHMMKLVLNYGIIIAIFLVLGASMGVTNFVPRVLASHVIVSLVLWIPFAYFTHEGYSTGPEAERSHNYRGLALFWLSLGLSMHRAHHMNPRLAWIQLLPFVERRQARGLRRLLPERDRAPA